MIASLRNNGKPGLKQPWLVNKAFPFEQDDVDSWAASAGFLSHALSTTQYAESVNVGLEDTSHLLNDTGL